MWLYYASMCRLGKAKACTRPYASKHCLANRGITRTTYVASAAACSLSPPTWMQKPMQQQHNNKRHKRPQQQHQNDFPSTKTKSATRHTHRCCSECQFWLGIRSYIIWSAHVNALTSDIAATCDGAKTCKQINRKTRPKPKEPKPTYDACEAATHVRMYTRYLRCRNL